jgi:hypothetical protein
VIQAESSTVYECRFTGAVSVNIDRALWSRTWWSVGGDSVTEYSQEAKTRPGAWNTRFDDDYATWLASQPPAAPACTGDC